eukprot:scaffold121884_cov10-Tisochrysis_lutea.AAC.1
MAAELGLEPRKFMTAEPASQHLNGTKAAAAFMLCFGRGGLLTLGPAGTAIKQQNNNQKKSSSRRTYTLVFAFQETAQLS